MRKEASNSETLKRYINRLKKWPEDKPPTPIDLNSLQREIRLTSAEKDRLDFLVENHERRARAALDTNAYNQAIIEMTKVVQLSPLDPASRVELASIYLQKSLERGYRRKDRLRAVKLAKTALILNPADTKAKLFLRNYRRMNSDFSAIKNRKYILPIILLAGIAGAIAIWQRDLPSNSNAAARNSSGTFPLVSKQEVFPETRTIDVDIVDLASDDWETEIIQAEVGRRNDDSFVKILGKLSTSKEYVEGMRLLVKGKDVSGDTRFTIPWTILDNDSPAMSPGDSTSLTLFRWLVDSEIFIDKLEITLSDLELLQEKPKWDWKNPVLVWDIPRPEGVSIDARIRRFELIEAYDRLVLTMELVLTNSGMLDISRLSMNISLGSDFPNFFYNPVKAGSPPMSMEERRVWIVTMGFPLDAVLVDRDVIIRITELGN
ncbi:hypothetical protein S1OALGB6SA_202 [Olavius algarvensis spirochete endosymbiont]|uniref:tetratricopeptide repeat protein n=1 Tax=Olavius algarvensis spirochete endosymbiont TaxID=260710 RepID=UPI000F13FA07|nr:hypothetical protein [Olavius algarvensis spirochete endosymbiont]CAD7842624.1 MAG: hypothetical protein [Olavius algarvensis spirochete endosymbiont]VDA99140.1 hypothetical protein S1OALGB6SA_202 [Olavius algarvensis spirochete endosymbiont]